MDGVLRVTKQGLEGETMINFGPDLGSEGAATKREFWWKVVLGWSLLLVGVGVSIVAYIGVFRPPTQDPGTWFSRSGAVVTVLAIYSERVLASLVPRMNRDVQPLVRWMFFPRQVSFTLIIFATVVWGYGDLLY